MAKYRLFSTERGIILQLEDGDKNICFRLPKGLPTRDDSGRRLAIKVDCRFDSPEEEGEAEIWFWLESVIRFFLLRSEEEQLYTVRFWKDVRWFIMRGEGGVEVSAGGIPVLCKDGDLFAFVIKPAGKDNYALPKGLIERGEKPQDTAKREVEEEAGLVVEAGPLLERVNYYYKHPETGERIYKEVFYFLLRVLSEKGEHDWEVEEVKKVPLGELPQILSYASEKKSARKLLELVKSGEIKLC